MSDSFKQYLKLSLLLILTIYSVIYVYAEINIGGVPTGGYILFNLPLGVVQLLLAIYLFKTKANWLRVISIIGAIVAGLVLTPPFLL